VVVSSVTAAVASQWLFGVHPAFAVPALAPSRSWFEVLVLPPLLGIACGLVTSGFVRAHFAISDRLGALRWPPLRKAFAAGLLVGVLVWLSRGLLLGAGHLAIPALLLEQPAWWVAAALVVGKVVATAVTFGGGGSGGLFAPALYVGAATGSACAGLVAALAPAMGVEQAAWAFVGMGAIVGAATGAPITAVLLVFELTDDYALVPPLLVVTGIALVVTRRLTRDTLYSGSLRRRGIAPESLDERRILAHIRVVEACDRAPLVVSPATPMAEVLERAAFLPQSVFPVLDGGRVLGVLPRALLQRTQREARGSLGGMMAGDVMVESPVVGPDESLEAARRRLAGRDLTAVPVVAGDGVFVGLISRDRIARTAEAHWFAEEDGEG
jgi:CIC family chloride channel protein